jgi:enoyl-CoA hydratase/carnithine racemase
MIRSSAHSDGGDMDEDLRVTRAGPIATVFLDRPQEQNRLTEAALRKLLALADELAASATVHVLVIRGAGDAWFSAGILNPVLRAALGKEAVLDLVRLANRVFDAVEALPQIVVAGLNGMARAGAVELALACDIRIAAQHARLAMPEAQWGGFPGAGAPVRLPALVGRGRALELICTGREIDAAEMARIGLVEHVAASDEFGAALGRLADSIAASGPLAVRGAKRIVGLRGEPGFAAARALSDTLRRALEWSDDVDEGIAAHREGRPPNFTGR